MKNTLTLTEKQTHFLKENRQDPITGDSFQMGDKIVFCAECKSAFLSESWEYMGNTHCNQTKTLIQIPQTKNLEFKKNTKKKKSKYITPSMTDTCIYWITDMFIWLIINFLFWHFSKGNIENPSTYYKTFAIFTLLLKDNNLVITSLGKVIRGISIIHIKSQKKINPILMPLRHFLPAFSLSLALFAYDIQFVITSVLLLFFICSLDLYFMLVKNKRFIDYILGTVIRKNENTKNIQIPLPNAEIPFQDRDFSLFSDYQDPTSLDGF